MTGTAGAGEPPPPTSSPLLPTEWPDCALAASAGNIKVPKKITIPHHLPCPACSEAHLLFSPPCLVPPSMGCCCWYPYCSCCPGGEWISCPAPAGLHEGWAQPGKPVVVAVGQVPFRCDCSQTQLPLHPGQYR